MDDRTQGDEPLLTPQQVARQLVVEETTLAVWRSTRRQPLPFVKVGGLVRYRRADVQAFIQSHLRCAA
jgi:excisionase family DNA binding protein